MLKIAALFILAQAALVFLPPILWRSTPDFALLHGPAKGTAVAVVWLLILTYAFLRSDRLTFRSIGVEARGTRLAQLGVGLAAGAAQSALGAALLAWSFGFEWRVNPRFAVGAVASGLALSCWSVVAEELLYRGYAFRRAIDRYGARWAVAGSIGVFAAVHWYAWGAWGDASRMLSVFCTTAAGGLLFALAFLRTGSIALPVGLHLGFVWSNADLFTGMFARWYENDRGLFVATGTEAYQAAAREGWLLVDLPYFVAMAVALAALLLATRGPRTASPALVPIETRRPPGPARAT